MSASEFEELCWHVGHDVEVVSCGRNGTIQNVSVECSDCGMVLMSFENPDTLPPCDPALQASRTEEKEGTL